MNHEKKSTAAISSHYGKIGLSHQASCKREHKEIRLRVLLTASSSQHR